MPHCLPFKGARLERVLASPQFSDGVFKNRRGLTATLSGKALPLLGEYFFGNEERFPKSPLPITSPFDAWGAAPASGFRVTWLGHSTVLFELGGLRILTDPVFGERASPLGFAGPRRFHPVPAALDKLPPLDVILLSHDHYDHLCKPTMRKIAALRVPIITALGVGAHLESFGVDPALIFECDWDETFDFRGVRFHATEAQHFSGRGPTDRNRTLWASWVIESDRERVFFSGDTGLSPHFEAIGARFGKFDLTLLEIGAFHPSWGGIHLGPDNALRAFEMLGGTGRLLPVHWGTFNLALHAWNAPPERLLEVAGPTLPSLMTPRLGAPIEPREVEGPDPWWRL